MNYEKTTLNEVPYSVEKMTSYTEAMRVIKDTRGLDR